MRLDLDLMLSESVSPRTFILRETQTNGFRLDSR